MKLRCAVLMLILLMLVTPLFAQTVSRTYYDGNPGPGELMSSGTLTYTLAAIQADPDSSVLSGVFDLTGSARIPGAVLFRAAISGAVGGLTATNLVFVGHTHTESSDVAGINGAIGNTAYLAKHGANGATSMALATGSAATANGWFYITDGANYTMATAPTRFMSFRIDKEGATGHYTAGTVVLTWYVYAP